MATNGELMAAAYLMARCHSADDDDSAAIGPMVEAMDKAMTRLSDQERSIALTIKNLFLDTSVFLHSGDLILLERAKEIAELLGGTYEAADHTVIKGAPTKTDRCGIVFHPPGKAAA